MLATVLSNYLGKTVEDRTGLTGVYDYKLEYADEPGRGLPTEEGGPEAMGASIFSALQEQLGLKLEASRVKVETLVVDRVHRPSDI